MCDKLRVFVSSTHTHTYPPPHTHTNTHMYTYTYIRTYKIFIIRTLSVWLKGVAPEYLTLVEDTEKAV